MRGQAQITLEPGEVCTPAPPGFWGATCFAQHRIPFSGPAVLCCYDHNSHHPSDFCLAFTRSRGILLDPLGDPGPQLHSKNLNVRVSAQFFFLYDGTVTQPSG